MKNAAAVWVAVMLGGCDSDAKILERVVDEFIRVSDSARLVSEELSH